MLHAVALLGVAAAAAAFSWGRWVNPIIDLGRELYVPWQLQHGAVLYRDIAYFNGPLSPYWNALCFSLFGAKLDTLLLANALILAAISVAIHHVAARLGGALAAFVTTAFFLGTVAFANIPPVGNYSYLLPYSHEITHGFLLLLTGFALALRASTIESRRVSFLLGVTIGLSLLTKIEIGASLLVGVTTQLLLARALGGARVKKAALLGGVVLPVAVAISALAMQLGLAGSVTSVVRGIFPPNMAAVSDLYFYRRMAGVEEIGPRLLGIAASCLVPVALLAAWWAYGRFHRAGERGCECVFAALAAVLTLVLLTWQFGGMVRLLPVTAAASVVLGLWLLARADLSPEHRQRAAGLSSFSLLALVLMSKKLLNVQLYYYGFVLAIPGLIIYFSLLLTWIPDELRRRGKDGRLFRAGAVGAIGAMALLMVVAVRSKHSAYTHRFEAPNASFYVPRARHEFLQRLTAELVDLLEDRSTLAVLPEGALLNFILAKPNPSPYIVYLPIEVTMFGDEVILDSYARAYPEVVVWINRDLKAYGYDSFGTDYGSSLATLITERYQLYKEIGEYENDDGRFGARIFVLPRPADAAATTSGVYSRRADGQPSDAV